MTRDDDENENDFDRQNRGVIRDVLQHAHRHVSDAISADKNNYADAAVRSYALAMDYFKTYLKMAEIEKHYGMVSSCHFLVSKDPSSVRSKTNVDAFSIDACAHEWMVLVFCASFFRAYYIREEDLLLLLLHRYARRAPTTGGENRTVSEAVAEIEERFDATKIQRKEGRGRQEGDEC